MGTLVAGLNIDNLEVLNVFHEVTQPLFEKPNEFYQHIKAQCVQQNGPTPYLSQEINDHLILKQNEDSKTVDKNLTQKWLDQQLAWDREDGRHDVQEEQDDRKNETKLFHEKCELNTRLDAVMSRRQGSVHRRDEVKRKEEVLFASIRSLRQEENRYEQKVSRNKDKLSRINKQIQNSHQVNTHQHGHHSHQPNPHQHTHHSHQLNTHQHTHGSFDAEITRYNLKISQCNSEVSRLQSEILKLEAQVGPFKTQINGFEQEIRQQDSEISKFKMEIQNKEEKIKNIKKRDRNREDRRKRAAARENHGSTGDQLSDQAWNRLQNERRDMKQNISGRYNTLKKELLTKFCTMFLEAVQMTVVKKDNTQTFDQIDKARLEKTVRAMQTFHENIKTIAEKEQDVRELRQAIGRLEKQQRNLDQNLTWQAKDIEDFERQERNYNSDIKSHEASIKGLKEKRKTVQRRTTRLSIFTGVLSSVLAMAAGVSLSPKLLTAVGFMATVCSPPALIGLGGLALVSGAFALGFWIYKRCVTQNINDLKTSIQKIKTYVIPEVQREIAQKKTKLAAAQDSANVEVGQINEQKKTHLAEVAKLNTQILDLKTQNGELLEEAKNPVIPQQDPFAKDHSSRPGSPSCDNAFFAQPEQYVAALPSAPPAPSDDWCAPQIN